RVIRPLLVHHPHPRVVKLEARKVFTNATVAASVKQLLAVTEVRPSCANRVWVSGDDGISPQGFICAAAGRAHPPLTHATVGLRVRCGAGTQRRHLIVAETVRGSRGKENFVNLAVHGIGEPVELACWQHELSQYHRVKEQGIAELVLLDAYPGIET